MIEYSQQQDHPKRKISITTPSVRSLSGADELGNNRPADKDTFAQPAFFNLSSSALLFTKPLLENIANTAHKSLIH